MTLRDFQEILKFVRPFVPFDRLEGAIPGLIINKEEGFFFASRNEGGVLYPALGGDVGSEKSLILLRDYVDRVLKLPGPQWSEIKVISGEQFKIQSGHYRFLFSSVSPEKVIRPDFLEKELFHVTEEFFDNLACLSKFMCDDDRKLNMYGLYASEDTLYSCDNVSAAKLRCEIPEGLKNTFFPYFCVNTLIKNRRADLAFSSQDRIVFVDSEKNVIQFFTLLNVKFPLLESSFQRLFAQESIELVSCATSEQVLLFKELAFGDLIAQSLEITVEGNILHAGSSTERAGTNVSYFDVPLKDEVATPIRFIVDLRRFVGGLAFYPNLRVVKDAIIMMDDAKTTTYVVMKKVGL